MNRHGGGRQAGAQPKRFNLADIKSHRANPYSTDKKRGREGAAEQKQKVFEKGGITRHSKTFEKRGDRERRGSSDSGKRRRSKPHKSNGKKVFTKISDDNEPVTLLETNSVSDEDIPDTVQDTVPFRRRREPEPVIDIEFMPVSTGITLSERFQKIVTS
eukprot:TRINITY_DN24488_c0_g1_i1.p1 TRINITY_DN24488_c0_g1~~TRINITY_DN24488_c0_g1_i1.p1  ORF type:complete len:174 (+),score=25.76 TRINITY_DN24488_c0_g1_i1:48-524(+)